MRRFACPTGLGLLLAVLLILTPFLFHAPGAPASTPVPSLNRAVLPLAFEENRGQTNADVRFLAHTPGGTMFFSPDGVVLALEGARPTTALSPSSAPARPRAAATAPPHAV